MLSGTVRIAVTEPGAAVSLDGHDAGHDPAVRPAARQPRARTWSSVSKAGFETIRKEVKLSGGDEATSRAAAGRGDDRAPRRHARRPTRRWRSSSTARTWAPAPWEGDLKPGVHVVEARGTDALAPPKPIEVVRRASASRWRWSSRRQRARADRHAHRRRRDQHRRRAGRQGGLGGDAARPASTSSPSRPPASARTSGPSSCTRARRSRRTRASRARPRVPSRPPTRACTRASSSSGSPRRRAPPTGSQRPALRPRASRRAPSAAGSGSAFGYAFGWIGVEAMALGAYDYSTASSTYAGTARPTSRAPRATRSTASEAVRPSERASRTSIRT